MDSAELVDMVVSDAPSSEVSDYIKSLLFAKASEKVDALKPAVANGLFGAENEVEVEDEIETEWLQLLSCDRRDLWQMHFVTGTGVFLHIPSAEARLLARQLDGIDFGNRVRIGFHAEAGIVEPSHRKGFGLGIRTRLDPQTAIVDLRLHPHRAIFHR